jgi:GR25 family glycosyltransferase involved in LPS biosynthesis
MSKLNKLFDKIYVLTIERNIDRHSTVYKQLGDTQFEFWYGNDIPNNFPQYEYVIQMPDSFFLENFIDKNYVSMWTKGQLGAYLSIRQMIEKVSNDHECVLIFEDDFQVLQKDWINKVETAVKELPDDWDILLLGYFYYGKTYKLAYHRKFRWIPYVYNFVKKFILKKDSINKLPKYFSSNLDLAGASLGGHAYCISKRGAEKLMNHMKPMKDSGDLLLYRLILNNLVNAYSIYPCLFDQNRAFKSKTEPIGL